MGQWDQEQLGENTAQCLALGGIGSWPGGLGTWCPLRAHCTPDVAPPLLPTCHSTLEKGTFVTS